MNKKPLCLIFAAFILLSPGLTAGESVSITLEKAWEMMEENNPELRNLILDQEILIRESGNRKDWIPGISAGAGLSRSSPLISWVTNPDNADLSEGDNWSLRGSVDLRFNINPNLSLEDQAEALELKILLLQYQAKVRDLRASLQKLYYQIITGYNTILLQEESIALARNRLEQIETQYNRGLRSDLELLTAKIALAGDLPALEKAKIDQEKKLITLRQYLGLEPGAPVELVSDPMAGLDDLAEDEVSVDKLKLQILEREDLQIAKLQIELAEINQELSAKKVFGPSFGASLGWSSGINPLFDPDSWTADDWRDSLSLGFSVSLPLDGHIEGSADDLSLARIEDKLEEMKLSLEESYAEAEGKLAYLLLDIELSGFNIEASELNITLQEQNFKKIQDNFESGRSSLLELNNSRQELRKVRLSLENEKLNRRLLLIDLARMQGR
ncbi:MAG: TolC family protein [Spirochaetales bacterium]|nr:TolC family protein [Spirochaetales bacterium]